MFDFAWSEIAIIGVVALVLIGPKDMPVALKGVTDMIKKARRMAGEFQGHVDEMLREADLGEVRQQFNEIRSFNIKGMVERAVDADGTLRRTMTGNPLNPDPVAPTTVAAPPPTPPPAPPPVRAAVVANVTPPPIPVLRAGASPFEVNMPVIGELTFPTPIKKEHPPFPTLFGAPVEPPAFVPPADASVPAPETARV
jgi:sec-independent protein translocase protein TatB